MPRKIGYGTFSPARKAALRKAQLESARKRRKHHSETRHHRKRAKAEEIAHRKRRRRQLGAAALGAGAAVGIAAAVIAAQNKGSSGGSNGLDKEQIKADVARGQAAAEARRAADSAQIEHLKTIAGEVTATAESMEQWQARVALYGDVIGEFSDLHEGRPEIFPTLPRAEVINTFALEAVAPSYTLAEKYGDTDFITLYHRTGGGKDLDAAQAKESILKTQKLKILNRDEARVGLGTENQLSWFSDKLNDSNTRGAFGEHVVQVKVPTGLLLQTIEANKYNNNIGEQSFGALSKIQETWLAINPDLLPDGVVFEDVPPEMITPPPPRKFRAPK